MNVVDSPPGTTSPSSPSSCSGFRTSRGSAPSCRSIAACSRKFPCRARTPIFMARILDFGYRRPSAPSEQEPDGDEDEPREGEDQRPRPLVSALLVVAVELEREREEEEAEGVRDVGPLVREMSRGLEDPPRGEDDPARARNPVPESDVEEADQRNHDPVEIAFVEEPEEPSADRQSGGHMEPEAESSGRAPVRGDPRQDEYEPDRDRHDRRPVAAVREQVEHEQPAGACKHEDEQWEPGDPQRERRRQDRQQLDDEQPEVKSGEEDLVVAHVG